MTRLGTDLNLQDQRRRGFRDSRDGKPFYCKTCGLGWQEVMACEETNCQIESDEDALKRFEPA